MKIKKVHLIDGTVLRFKNAKMRYWEPSDTYGFRDKDTKEFLGIVPMNQVRYISTEEIINEQEI